jgi:LysM repeat protein
LIGDFRSEEPTNEQLESLFKLSKALMEDLNITSEFVKGHSEMPGYSTKACPVIGMDDLRTKIKEYNEGGELPTFIENTGVPELPKNTYHTVVRGDTLWNIAEDYGNMTVRELLLLNPSINPRKITLGQEIRIK